jgi:multidrug efflux pump subunit AcrB
MLTLTVLVMGAFFLMRLHVDLLPSITYPRIAVRITAPGISPEVAVEEITRPLEEALAATEGVVQVYSQTREGQVSVDLFFQPGGNIDQALNDATASVNRARGQLPETVENPRISKVDPSQLPVVEFALTSPQLEGRALRVFAEEDLARELGVVPGVAAVDVSGGAREEVQVDVDLDRLQAQGVGITQVLDALRSENQDISGGRLEGSRDEALTRTIGRFRTAREIEKLSFLVPAADPTAPARRIFLRDFATVVDGTEDERVIVHLNRDPAVKISIQKQPEANTVEVVKAIQARVAELRRSGLIPAGAELVTTLDEARFISNSIQDVAMSGLVGALLAGAAVLLFLGSVRQTLIILLAIPVGTLIAVVLMGVSGLSLNIFSLGGLSIGIGAVDSCIVVLENIVSGSAERREALGSAVSAPPEQPDGAAIGSGELVEVAVEKAGELESALVASTTTNLVAVVPFLLIGGFVSLLFNELILTVGFTVGAALVTSLTMVPMLASRLLAIPRTSGLRNFILVRRFNEGFEQVAALYGRLLARALDHRRLLLLAAFGGLGGLMVMLLPQIPTEILPRIGTGQAQLSAQFPPGTPLATSRKVMEAVKEVLLAQPDTQYAFTTVGGFLFGSGTSENPLRGSATITLKPGADVEKYVVRVNRELAKLNLVDIRLRLSPGQVRGLVTSNSPVRGAEIDVILQGTDDRLLQQAGRSVLAELDSRAKLSQFRPDADPTQPEVQIRRDRERAAELGISSQQIGETIATAVEGSIPTQLQRGERLVDVRVRLAKQSIRSTSQLARLPLFVQGGRQVRLSDVAEIKTGRTPGQIQRINQRNVFILAGNLNEGASLGEAIAEVESIVRSMQLPAGVSTLPSAAAQSNRELQSSIVMLGGLAVFLVFIVMAVQYDSLIDPLIILFTVPLALAGGVLGLWVTGTAIGATVLIGVILLVGVIVGNGIILVERANQILERDAAGRRAAMLEAAPARLRPIAMTTIIAVLGLLPLALGMGEGTELLRPLGITVFAGLSLGTLLTLFVVPCFYLTLHDLFSWNPWRRGTEADDVTEAPAPSRRASRTRRRAR